MGLIDGVVSVGPHECMPNKIAESQYFHVAEREGLASLTVPVNGDAVDPEILDSFAFEVRARFEARRLGRSPPATVRVVHPPPTAPVRRRLPVLQPRP